MMFAHMSTILSTKWERNLLQSKTEEIGTAVDVGETMLLMVTNRILGLRRPFETRLEK